MREIKQIVLVIGGAGFIGSHLCERLVSLGTFKVISIDNYFYWDQFFLEDNQYKIFLYYSIPLLIIKFITITSYNLSSLDIYYAHLAHL